MKFIIRDDDTCALTQVSEIEKCYKNLFGRVPVCLSITPFRIPGNYFDVDPSIRDKEIPLGNNPELIDFLREGIDREVLDVAMHGYSHIYYRGLNGRIPEYCHDEDKLFSQTKIGKEYLEHLLDYTINTFVPPSNSLSRKGLEAVINNKMNIIINAPSLFRFRYRPFEIYNLINGVKIKLWKAGKRAKYPFVLKFKTHKELGYYTLYSNSDFPNLIRQLDFCHSVNGVFVLSTHYKSFHKRISSGETIEAALYEIIDYLSGKRSVEYITYRELW